MMVSFFRLLLVSLVLTLGFTGVKSSESNNRPDYVSIGGVGYKSSCGNDSLVLQSLNPTYRLFGYRNSLNQKYFITETIRLKKDCSAVSYELGSGQWCQAGGSNAGFYLDFINSTDDENNNFHTLRFYGQEPYCEALVNPCFCE